MCAPPPRPRLLLIGLIALLLAACASTPKRFYGEDGPPEHVPSDLLSTPDAVPHNEPLNPFANRPYVALGRTFVPFTTDAPFHQRGVASWYGRQFQGNRTASGERYDMFAMTAAHPTLPIPSYARVTRTDNGRSVIVRINDRGPFLRGRIIDLSYAAAARLGLAGPGSGEVEVDRILPMQAALTPGPSPAPRARGEINPSAAAEARGEISSSAAAGARGEINPSAAAEARGEISPSLFGRGAGVREQEGSGASAGSEGTAVAFAVAPPAALNPSPSSARAEQGSPLASTASVGEEPGVRAAGAVRWSVQLGAFAVPMNADALRDRLALLLGSPEASALPAELRSPRVERQAGLSRVLIGAAPDRGVALQWSHLLEQYLARPTALFAR
jgi:rare lipoprotein A